MQLPLMIYIEENSKSKYYGWWSSSSL